MLDSSVLGRRIREARQESGLTQEQLAAQLGADQSKISRIERGRDLSSLTLTQIAEATGKGMDYFVSLEERPFEQERARFRARDPRSPEARRALDRLIRFADEFDFLLDLDQQ
jgi:transcriptional regulator with XRE-family HTH domain